MAEERRKRSRKKRSSEGKDGEIREMRESGKEREGWVEEGGKEVRKVKREWKSQNE